MKIIFAQGNPGRQYAKTRHNVGFLILDELAKQKHGKWLEKPKFKGDITEVEFGNTKAILVKPITFYNESGNSIRALVDFYKINPAKDLLVIHDDLALPFGTIRTREKGSDAGNNGIKNIISHIGERFNRMRIGIKAESKESPDDTKFVLNRFNRKEAKQLKTVIVPQSLQLIEQFVEDKLEITSYRQT